MWAEGTLQEMIERSFLLVKGCLLFATKFSYPLALWTEWERKKRKRNGWENCIQENAADNLCCVEQNIYLPDHTAFEKWKINPHHPKKGKSSITKSSYWNTKYSGSILRYHSQIFFYKKWIIRSTFKLTANIYTRFSKTSDGSPEG